MTVAIAQFNPTVGDMDANVGRMRSLIADARAAGATLVVFPELAVFGYPPKDLLLRADAVKKNADALAAVARAADGITVVTGYVGAGDGGTGKGVLNAAAVCRDGRVVASYAKRLLPTYDVFDESRHFRPGTAPVVVDVGLDRPYRRVGITICEDLFNDHQFDGRRVYGVDPIAETVGQGAGLIINLSASPFAAGKYAEREQIFAGQVRAQGVPLVFVNQVGGNDDLIFDGASVVLDATGRVVARARAFAEDLLLVDLAQTDLARVAPYPDRIESIRRALVLGTRDYLEKCGFDAVIVGLSGGIDSAVTGAIAVEAIGADRVHGMAMPSRFSSSHSIEDAEQLAANLGIPLHVVPIEPVHRAMEEAVAPYFAGRARDVADENIQARIRGNLLMAMSNKLGYLLLSTGNKSEMAVGYCTLYGDMCGGLAVLSDVPKTTVYALARHMNATSPRPPIPVRSIEKPPSAELREDQTDQDALPPYALLDAVLEQYIEHDRSSDEIVALGFDRAEVDRIVAMVDRCEYKRKQAPVGLKVTSRAFGTGRRMPIAARYR